MVAGRPARVDVNVRQSFSARQRIRRRVEFQRLYTDGRRVHGRFMTLVILPGSSEASRLGISATRKLGNAVQRNLAKRRVREIFRRQQASPGIDIVVIPRPALIEASYDVVAAEYKSLLERQARSRPAARDHRGVP